jgi:hypothetical protein
MRDRVESTVYFSKEGSPIGAGAMLLIAPADTPGRGVEEIKRKLVFALRVCGSIGLIPHDARSISATNPKITQRNRTGPASPRKFLTHSTGPLCSEALLQVQFEISMAAMQESALLDRIDANSC